jgi:dTMP kinase
MSLLITLEGIDGSGKTTLINNLKKSGELDLIIHNWRDTELGQKIWHLINETRAEGKNSLPSTWTYIFLIFSAFDELNQKIIKPNLQENKVAIIDRYIDSTFAYQGLEGGLGINIIQEIAKKTIDLPLPDITFVLDVDPQQAQERLKKRKLETGEYTNWDNLKLEFHHRIRNYYLELKKAFPERIYIINAGRSEVEILEEAQTVIKKCLLKRTEKNDLPRFVRVVIQNKEGKFLLVKDKWGWNFPGGKIEPNESPKEAAKREVFEETNLVVGDLEKIAEKNIFFANLPKEIQNWEGHFFRAKSYSGEIKIKEIGKILDINFISYNSFINGEKYQPYQFYWEKIRNLEKYAKQSI